MDTTTYTWDRGDTVKYGVSKFEEEQFQQWLDNGGKEKLRARIVYFDYSDKTYRREKEGRYWE